MPTLPLRLVVRVFSNARLGLICEIAPTMRTDTMIIKKSMLKRCLALFISVLLVTQIAPWTPAFAEPETIESETLELDTTEDSESTNEESGEEVNSDEDETSTDISENTDDSGMSDVTNEIDEGALKPQDSSLIEPSSIISGTRTISSMFPDPVLAQYVATQLSQKLGQSFTVNSNVTQNQLNTIDRLNISGSLHNIEGMQYLNGLVEVRIANAQITERIPQAFITDIYPNVFYVANGQRYENPEIDLTNETLQEVFDQVPPILFQIAENSNGATIGTWIIRDANYGTVTEFPAVNGSELLNFNFTDAGRYNIELLLGSNIWMGFDQSQYFFPVVYHGVTNGIIQGTVTDQEGNALPGVTISLSDGSTIETDQNGFYQYVDKTPGDYTVSASLSGYNPQSKSTSLTSGQTAIVNFTLIRSPGSVIGTVLDESTGQPIAGAEVILYSYPDYGETGRATSDENGMYYFSSVPAGTYQTSASAEGYNTNTSQVLPVGNNETTQLDVLLTPANVTLSGTVYDKETDLPISGATVILSNGQTITADENGYYSFSVFPGTYTVTASADGYTSNQESITLETGSDYEQDLLLEPLPAMLEVYVLDEASSEPLVNATVTVIGSDGRSITVTTDDEGKYLFMLPLGDYDIVGSLQGYTTDENSTTLGTDARDEIVTVTLLLQRAIGSVEGYVFDGTNGNAPIEGATVILNTGQTTTTDQNGYYIFEGLEVGAHVGIARAQGYNDDVETFVIRAGETTRRDYLLYESSDHLTIFVSYEELDGDAASGIIVSLETDKGVIEQQTNNGGMADYFLYENRTYTLLDPEVSGYTATVYSAKDEEAQEAFPYEINFVDNQTVYIVLTPIPPVLTGGVIDAEDREILAEATITATDENGNTYEATANELSVYSFRDLPAGTYTVTASKEGYQSATKTGVVLVNGETTTASFNLIKLRGTLTGTVIYSNGDPVTNAPIVLSNGSEVTTDDNGQYGLILDEGEYIVTETVDDQEEEVTIVAGQTAVANFVIELPPGNLEGTVYDVAGGIIEGADIVATSNTLTGATYTARTDSNGHYEFLNIEAGAYTITASYPTYASQTKVDEVQSSQTTVVDFVLSQNPGIIEGVVTDRITQEPIPNATIVVSPDGLTVETDENGYYRIVLTEGYYTLTASKDGYDSEIFGASVLPNQTTTLNFELGESEPGPDPNPEPGPKPGPDPDPEPDNGAPGAGGDTGTGSGSGSGFWSGLAKTFDPMISLIVILGIALVSGLIIPSVRRKMAKTA